MIVIYQHHTFPRFTTLEVNPNQDEDACSDHGQTASLQRLKYFSLDFQTLQKLCSVEGEWPMGVAMNVFNIPAICGALLAYIGIASSLTPFPSTPVPLSSYFDNQAASIDGTTGNFNKYGSTYAAEYLPTGPWLFNGVTVNLLLLFYVRGG